MANSEARKMLFAIDSRKAAASLTARKWALNKQLFDHLSVLQVFGVENGASGKDSRSDNQSVIN